MLEVSLLGTPLVLTCSGAVWVPSEGTLLAADLHLGKGATFRAAGIPVPAGTSAATLARLTAVSEQFEPRRIVVLGDLWHGENHGTELFDWIAASPAEVCLVPGNHDRHALKQLDMPGLCVLAEPVFCGPFRLAHHPTEGSFSICGHVHPVVQLGRRRFKCYVQTASNLILPSFGEFTGGAAVDRGTETRIWVCGGDEVVAL